VGGYPVGCGPGGTAEATRQRIIDAAVGLFSERGYGETGLADVLQRAGVTKGAFYYHFDSKDALAVAVIDQFQIAIRDAFRRTIDPPAPGLENIIRGTFAVARLIQTDVALRIGNELSQSLAQVSDAGPRVFRQTSGAFVDEVKKAFTTGDIRDDADPDDVGEVIWIGVIGCQFLSAAIGDDLVARLARTWRVLLRAIVPEPSVPFFYEVLDRSLGDSVH
jgi:AcrR family transcriptional regulator